MKEIDLQSLENYLQQAFGEQAKLTGIGEIGSLEEQGMKDFGYGKPLLVHFELNGKPNSFVLSTMKGDKYGHQFYWDRAAILMFQYDCAARMDKHVKPMGLGYIDSRGRLIPVKEPKEFFLLTEKVEGHDYFLDLERMRKGDVREEDFSLAKEFARWLAKVHSVKKKDEDLYLRRIRDLIGHSECIWGLIDAYPYPYEHFTPEEFQKLEKRLIDWRWKFRKFTHRLSAVHGDFHPWNVLVRDNLDFSVLDRSRGEWGEPADDVATMSCNYLLFGLYDQPKLSGPFEKLYLTFWEEYLSITNDKEILKLIAPFYVFRGLVIASPEWYPNHPVEVRKGLFRFIQNVLEDENFDYMKINKYME
ncbi:aminoglycoside phosphotransferase family protein [Desulfonauticus submarinus]|uniref:Phosphotransferase enzyme family protein n=1 Tax=Desulfonauticus submarinus TaxID=206665 RepID=A0A1H0CR37_9BACT|nr:aminoglycoside phosphotransferase family protein [Desulfonauticus submarinus]SDN60372.1 Phosphotransferase enzyme family protein [Desulfonauticus submarinus]